MASVYAGAAANVFLGAAADRGRSQPRPIKLSNHRTPMTK
jgi:hypothetical protein